MDWAFLWSEFKDKVALPFLLLAAIAGLTVACGVWLREGEAASDTQPAPLAETYMEAHPLPIADRVQVAAATSLAVVESWHERPISQGDLQFLYIVQEWWSGYEYYLDATDNGPLLAIVRDCQAAVNAISDVYNFNEAMLRAFIAEDDPAQWPSPFVDVVECYAQAKAYAGR